MKVTTKGQVTIPLELRMKAGITPGSEIIFSEEKGRIYLRKRRELTRYVSGRAFGGQAPANDDG